VHSSQRDTDEVLAYVEGQAHERVIHLEKAASERPDARRPSERAETLNGEIPQLSLSSRIRGEGRFATRDMARWQESERLAEKILAELQPLATARWNDFIYGHLTETRRQVMYRFDGSRETMTISRSCKRKTMASRRTSRS
jgi:hypothetical protein